MNLRGHIIWSLASKVLSLQTRGPELDTTELRDKKKKKARWWAHNNPSSGEIVGIQIPWTRRYTWLWAARHGCWEPNSQPSPWGFHSHSSSPWTLHCSVQCTDFLSLLCRSADLIFQQLRLLFFFFLKTRKWYKKWSRKWIDSLWTTWEGRGQKSCQHHILGLFVFSPTAPSRLQAD